MGQLQVFCPVVYAESGEPFHAHIGLFPSLEEAMFALRDWLLADIWSRGEWDEASAYPWGFGLEWELARDWAADLPVDQLVGLLAGHLAYVAAVDLRSVRSGPAVELPLAAPPSYSDELSVHAGGGHCWPSFQNLVFATE